jgi:hypothetical protein
MTNDKSKDFYNPVRDLGTIVRFSTHGLDREKTEPMLMTVYGPVPENGDVMITAYAMLTWDTRSHNFGVEVSAEGSSRMLRTSPVLIHGGEVFKTYDDAMAFAEKHVPIAVKMVQNLTRGARGYLEENDGFSACGA